MNNRKTGILGFGEVGSAVFNVYTDAGETPSVYDPYKNRTENMADISVLNVCIPYIDEKFITNVVEIAKKCNNLELIIIHSTIVLGVVEKLCELLKDVHIVHSPVRGVHPNLTEGIKTFVKYVGHAKDKHESGIAAKKHLESIGIKTTVTTCTNTILMKLLSTTYYGMCIAFTEDMGKLCDKESADFDMICDWNVTYNEGYKILGKPNVVRPVLTRIEDGKTIGGHCVIPNAKLLKEMYPECTAWDYVLKYSG